MPTTENGFAFVLYFENERFTLTTNFDMKTSIGAIGNYYGGLSAKKEGDKYFWGIEDYHGTDWEEIPKKMYDRLISYEKQRVRKQKQNGA